MSGHKNKKEPKTFCSAVSSNDVWIAMWWLISDIHQRWCKIFIAREKFVLRTYTALFLIQLLSRICSLLKSMWIVMYEIIEIKWYFKIKFYYFILLIYLSLNVNKFCFELIWLISIFLFLKQSPVRCHFFFGKGGGQNSTCHFVFIESLPYAFFHHSIYMFEKILKSLPNNIKI